MTEITPMMRQYLDLKDRYPNEILFFHLGDFYETFYEDAELVSKELDIVLTARGDVPMAGVPIKRAEKYINKLLKRGYKVALADQLEDPSEAQGLVQRDVVRVITPGTILEDGVLERGLNNYLVALLPEGKDGGIGLAFVDVSTGEFGATRLDTQEALRTELTRLPPAELVIPEGVSIAKWIEDVEQRVAVTELRAQEFKADHLARYFELGSLAGLGLDPLACRSAGGLLSYLLETQKETLKHLKRPSAYSISDHMQLDPFTQRNLELIREIGGGTRRTLLAVLNETVTGMGERRLRQWLLSPLVDRAAIERRLDAVTVCFDEGLLRAELRKLLAEVHDIERLVGRIGSGRATPRDLLGLGGSLQGLPELRAKLGELAEGGESNELDDLNAMLNQLQLEDLSDLLRRAIREDAPLTLKEGGIIRPGFDVELDSLKAEERDARRRITDLERTERERTGINSLKVGYNKVFGYYIEVTKRNLDRVPSDYHRKQTLANAERFVTPKLKGYEDRIFAVQERAKELEYERFIKLRERVVERTAELQSLADILARLDIYTALAEVARKNGYCRPTFTDQREIHITGGRHPIVERSQEGSLEFVPNDLEMGEDERVIILTGPNMSGKSVYTRQNALIILMAQMGSYVPATSATLPIVDKIFARVGASDMLSAGYSTFMVEMLETANILNNATEASLIILDEMGRGTSTFDGVSIAWAVAEHLTSQVRARTLFATHYHELTKLEERIDGVFNMNVRVKEYGNEVVFLHRVARGKAEGSYGVHVARLAGLPKEVTQTAQQILEQILKNNPLDAMGEVRDGFDQLSLFEENTHPVLEELEKLDLEDLTPIEALNLLARLKDQL
ncbi:MAG: DNA mismatch repair protein MutS [Candidatus Bipolaricaulia bacterium]